jgi:hypothetical protein
MVKTMRNGMKMYDIHKKTYIGKRAERRDHQNDFITKKKKISLNVEVSGIFLKMSF